MLIRNFVVFIYKNKISKFYVSIVILHCEVVQNKILIYRSYYAAIRFYEKCVKTIFWLNVFTYAI